MFVFVCKCPCGDPHVQGILLGGRPAPPEGYRVRYKVTPALVGLRPWSSISGATTTGATAPDHKRPCDECLCHAIAMLLPCYCHVIAMLLPCCCHVVAMLLPCYCHVIAMLLPCYCHVLAMFLPCYCHVIAMLLPWCCHDLAMFLPCHCHAIAMLLPCCCHVITLGFAIIGSIIALTHQEPSNRTVLSVSCRA